MSKAALQAACLSVGLVSAWAPTAEADVLSEVRFSAAISDTVHHATIMLDGIGSGGDGGVFLTNLTIPGSGSGGWASTLPAASLGSGYAMIGLTGGTGSGGLHLVVSRWGSLTHLDVGSFENNFPGYSETQIIDSLLFGTASSQDFLRAQFATRHQTLGGSSNLFAYSDATLIGTISVEVVSVPAPPVLAGLPFLLVCRRRRR